MKAKKETRVLVCAMAYDPFIGGDVVAIQEIAKRLPGFHLDVVTARFKPELPKVEEAGNVTVHRVGRGSVTDKYLYPWLATRRAKEIYKEEKFHVVWGMMATWGGWAALKIKEALPEVRYVLTLQSGDTDAFIRRRTWFWHWRYRQIYRRPDGVQAISNFLADRARRFGYAGRAAVVPNGIDASNFKPEGPVHDLRKEFGNGKPVVVHTGRLVAKNGVKDLLRAVATLDANLLFLGSGAQRAELEALADKLGASDRVRFHSWIDNADVPSFLRGADVFCRPSLSEGFGNSFVEAMACGVPVVATQVGGIVDFFTDKVNGLACEPGDPASIAAAIDRLLRDKPLRGKVVAGGLETARHYRWEEIAEQVGKILKG